MIFAGATVVIAMLGMLTLGINILNGPAIAAALTVALAMFSALTLLPALLGAYGHRIKVPRGSTRGRESWLEPAGAACCSGARGCSRPARSCCWSSWPFPVTGMKLGLSDAGNDEPGMTTRVAYDQLSDGFGPGFNGLLLAVASVPRGSTAELQIARLQQLYERQNGERRARLAADIQQSRRRGGADGDPRSKPQADATKDLLEQLRDRANPAEGDSGVEVSVGGATATGVDVSQVLSDEAAAVHRGRARAVAGAADGHLPLARDPADGASAASLLSIGTALGVIIVPLPVTATPRLAHRRARGEDLIESFLPVLLFAVGLRPVDGLHGLPRPACTRSGSARR